VVRLDPRSEVKNNLIHLTNVAVQKTADEYGEFGAQSEEDGSKWDLVSVGQSSAA
jgi:hypothetical protein